MTRSKLITMLLLIAGVFFINSCGDDDNNNPIDPPDVNDNFFKATTGDTWTYESYNYDENSGELNTQPENEYTVEITGKETVSDKESYVYNFTYNDSTPSHKKHFIPDGKVLEGLSLEIMPSSLPFDLPIENAWVTIANLTSNEWQVYSMPFTDIEIEIQGFPAVLTGNLEIMGYSNGTEDVIVGNNTHKCQKIDMKYRITITSGTIMGSDIPEKIELELVGSFYYAENLGLLKTEFKPQTLYLSAYPYKINGFMDICTSLNVK